MKRRARDVRNLLLWLGRDFAANPRLALYLRRQGLKNLSFFLALKARTADEQRVVLAAADVAEMPRIVWIYWHQGEAEAPFLVRRCIDTWRTQNPGWEVRVLDAQSVQQYADMSDVPEGLPFRYNADLLRVRLMRDHGGVWADATTYCHRPLDEWIWLHMTGGFFVFRNASPDCAVENWFIASTPGHVLSRLWAEDSVAYMRRNPKESNLYFIFFYLFQWRILRDAGAGAAFDQTAGLPALPALVMMESLKGIVPKEQIFRLVSAGLPLSKLSRHTDTNQLRFERFHNELEGRKSRPPILRSASALKGSGAVTA